MTRLPLGHPDRPVPAGAALISAASWFVGMLRGIFELATTTPQQRRQLMRRRWQEQWRASVRSMVDAAPPARRMAILRQALLDQPRPQVAALLGTPPATSAIPDPASKLGYWKADIWYYPLDIARRQAIAISFENDKVNSIDPLEGPAF